MENIAANRQVETVMLTAEQAAREIADRAIALVGQSGRRVIVGISGGPGAGKSTIAAAVIGRLNTRIDGGAAGVPMDGFHMKQAKLEKEELIAFKGAPQTFEAGDFVELLKRLKSAKTPVPVPGYSREIEDVVPDAFTIAANVPILITEGNYLLLDTSPWNEITGILDLSVYIDVPRDIVRKRLLKRHAEHGLFTEERNRKHVEQVDLVNYDTVAKSAPRANLVIRIDTRD